MKFHWKYINLGTEILDRAGGADRLCPIIFENCCFCRAFVRVIATTPYLNLSVLMHPTLGHARSEGSVLGSPTHRSVAKQSRRPRRAAGQAKPTANVDSNPAPSPHSQKTTASSAQGTWDCDLDGRSGSEKHVPTRWPSAVSNCSQTHAQ